MKKITKKVAILLAVIMLVGGLSANIAYADPGQSDGAGYRNTTVSFEGIKCSSAVLKGNPYISTFRTTGNPYFSETVCGFIDTRYNVADTYGYKTFHLLYRGELTYDSDGTYRVSIDTTDIPLGTYKFLVLLKLGDAGMYYHKEVSVYNYDDVSDNNEPGAAPSNTAESPALVASPTNSTVLVNGANVAFDAYNINGNNYFKLRDLAYVLNGTQKQFEVGWDGPANAISLTSGLPYTVVSGEMQGKGAGAKTPAPTDSKILLDGAEVCFTAYYIEGNNYFKLRDIGAAFDFGVEWDGAQNTIVIDTSKSYTPD